MSVLNASFDQVQGHNWMSAIPDHMELQHICMPGSHDAGMYKMHNDYAAMSSDIVGLIVTQKLSILEQLKAGARYFDLRPAMYESTDDKNFYVFHGDGAVENFGPLLKDILSDVSVFMSQSNTKELVILNLSHFRRIDGDNDFRFMKLLFDQLGSLLITQKIHRHMPFSSLAGKVIVRIEDGRLIKNIRDDIDGFMSKAGIDKTQKRQLQVIVDGFNICDSYADSIYYNTMREDQIKKFREYGEGKTFSNDHDLFLLNWTLTPGTTNEVSKKIINHLIDIINPVKQPDFRSFQQKVEAGPLYRYAAEVNPKIFYHDEHDRAGNRNKLFSPNKAGRIVNIINSDFVLHPDILKTCFYVMENYDGRVRKISHIRPANNDSQRLDGHGESIYLHAVNSGDHQKWLVEIVDADQQTYRITSIATLHRLDGYLSRGPYLCGINNSDYQLWQKKSAADGQGVYLKSVHEQAYLSHADGRMSLVTSTPSESEKWILEFAE